MSETETTAEKHDLPVTPDKPDNHKTKVETTDAQRLAIHSKGCSICVAAGAGSGKTFVLVERFIALVRDGADPREILTITFTEKAAREMRERIGKGLGAEASKLEGAWISTIHGFCARLLRTYAVEADVDPAFAVLTELPQARVRRAAFADAQALLRREWPEAYDAIVDRIRWGHDQEGFAGIDLRVFSLHEAQRAAGSRPRPLTAEQRPARFDAIDTALVGAALEDLHGALEAYEGALAAHPRPSAVAREKCTEVRTRVRGLESLAAPDGGAHFTPQAHLAIQAIVKSVKGNGLFRDERVVVADKLEALARAYVEGPARALGAALDDLVARFDAAYRARKAELAALDFGDLEERARELLEGRPDVAEEVRRRFRGVMIDEFQDTSRLQQKIVDLVRRPGAFFAVGDVKQSVYGFRHAEVKGLLEVEEEVRRTGGLVVPLDTSFRTRPSVLAYVDAVFEQVFGEPDSEVRHQPLRAATSVAFLEKEAASVELLLAHGETLEVGRQAEARAIAGRLASIVEGALLRGTNPLRKDSFDKPLRYKDCAILFRAMTELPVYERALRERGVPYRVDRGGGFFEAAEVVDALNLLRVIALGAGPGRDELALAAVLRSPIVGLSDDALMALARLGVNPNRPSAGAGSLVRALERFAEPSALTDTDRARIGSFVAMLGELRALRGRTSVRDLLEVALERTGLGEASLLRTGNARGFGNLRKLLSIVDELEADPALGLDAVILALEDLRASAAREAEVSLSGGDEDAVALMTVHAAKGLEWPLVVCADLGRADIPWPEPVAWSAETGCVPILLDPTSPFGRIEPASYSALFERRKVRDREESKRLLYVAMTRARDHLILAGARGGQRDSGLWLAWSMRPLNLGLPPIAVEDDESLPGAKARTLPGPDVRGVRVLQVGTPAGHDEYKEDEYREGASRDAARDGAGATGLAPVPAPIPSVTGPLGPEAGARTLLDEATRERLRQGLPPSFPREHGPTEDDRAEAAVALGRALRPLPESDLSGSLYVVTEVLSYESCPRLYLYEQVLGARGLTGDSLVADEPRSASGGQDQTDGDVGGAEADASTGAAPALDDPLLLARHVLGTATHRVLELGPDRTPARVREILADETKGTLSASGLAAAAKLVLEWVGRFERSPLGKRTAAAAAQDARNVLREEPFLVQIPLGGGEEPVLLRGTADLVFRDAAGSGAMGSVLVDYKTNDLTSLEVPAKAKSYALQLQLYALAVGAYMGEPVREAWLSFLAADQSTSVDVSADALEVARARLAAFVAARRRGEFPPKPGSLCRTCAFRSVCPGALQPVSPERAPTLVLDTSLIG